MTNPCAKRHVILNGIQSAADLVPRPFKQLRQLGDVAQCASSQISEGRPLSRPHIISSGRMYFRKRCLTYADNGAQANKHHSRQRG
jgi:hypothetical protein